MYAVPERQARFHKSPIWATLFSISKTFKCVTPQNNGYGIRGFKEIVAIASAARKSLSFTFLWGFGNPYGDPWNTEIVAEWVARLSI